MKLSEKYEAKCKEATRFKADLRAAQEEIERLRNAPARVERVEVTREIKVPVEIVREVVREVRTVAPACNIAAGMAGTNADKVKALQAALGVAVARLRDAGLGDTIEGLEWGSD